MPSCTRLKCRRSCINEGAPSRGERALPGVAYTAAARSGLWDALGCIRGRPTAGMNRVPRKGYPVGAVVQDAVGSETRHSKPRRAAPSTQFGNARGHRTAPTGPVTHVGSRHVVVCVQHGFVEPVEGRAIQREVSGRQAQQCALRCRAHVTGRRSARAQRARAPRQLADCLTRGDQRDQACDQLRGHDFWQIPRDGGVITFPLFRQCN